MIYCGGLKHGPIFSLHWKVGSVCRLLTWWACDCFNWKLQRKGPCDFHDGVREVPRASAKLSWTLAPGKASVRVRIPLLKTTTLERPLQVPTWQLSWAPGQSWHHLPARRDGHHGCSAHWAPRWVQPHCHLTVVTWELPRKNCPATPFLNSWSTKLWARENDCCTTSPDVKKICRTATQQWVWDTLCVCVCECVHLEGGEVQGARWLGWEFHWLCDLGKFLTLSEPHLSSLSGQYESLSLGVMGLPFVHVCKAPRTVQFVTQIDIIIPVRMLTDFILRVVS